MDFSLLLPLFLLVLFIPILLSGRKQRRQLQEMQDMQRALEEGDVVVTTSGLRGVVTDASFEDTVDLEIADGVVTTWVRAAVREKVAVDDATVVDDAPAAGGSSAANGSTAATGSTATTTTTTTEGTVDATPSLTKDDPKA
jgi:preprotein translocase subunit YajC